MFYNTGPSKGKLNTDRSWRDIRMLVLAYFLIMMKVIHSTMVFSKYQSNQSFILNTFEKKVFNIKTTNIDY